MKLTNNMRDAFVRAAMADVPQVDFHAQVLKIIIDAAEKKLPPAVRTIWKNKELSHFVAMSKDWFCDSYIEYPGMELSLGQAERDKIAEIKAAKSAQDDSNNNLRLQLRNATYAFTTRKALAEALPEFEKYLPEDPAKADRSLPTVTNVVSDFVKAGWPAKAKKK
jgi:hypothetical protein